MEDIAFDAAEVNAGESIPVILDLFRWCALLWRPNEHYDIGECLRPNKATGFAYQCAIAGLTGAREPQWPTTLGQTIQSGSATFSTVSADTNGVLAISNPNASVASGLTVSSVSVNESTKILATYAAPSSAVVGQEFEVTYTFTLDGVQRIARQIVRIVEE